MKCTYKCLKIIFYKIKEYKKNLVLYGYIIEYYYVNGNNDKKIYVLVCKLEVNT